MPLSRTLCLGVFLTVLGLLLATTTTAAAAAAAAEQPATPSPPQESVTEEMLEARLARARESARQGKHAPALADFLFFFDNSRDVVGYAALRLSEVPNEVAGLGRDHPPALAALRERRDAREQLLIEGEASFVDAQELVALNSSLKDANSTFVTFDKLKQSGEKGVEAGEMMLDLVWEDLVKARRYADIGDKAVGYARQIAWGIAEYQISRDFPDGGVQNSDNMQFFLRTQAVVSGGRAYEALLALNQAEAADNLLRWLLSYDASGEMYARLITHALTAGRPVVARELVNRAHKSLPESDLKAVRDAGARIPSSTP